MRTTGSPVPAVSTLSDSARPSGTLNVSTVVELSVSSRTANSHTGRCLHETAGAGGGRSPHGCMETRFRAAGSLSSATPSYYPVTRRARPWSEDRRLAHHGNGRPSRKNPPVGPSSASVAAHTTLAAPSATGRPPGRPAPPEVPLARPVPLPPYRSVHTASSLPLGSVKWNRRPPGKENGGFTIFPPACLTFASTSSSRVA